MPITTRLRDNPRLALRPGTLVSNHVTRRQFRVKELLGIGGFGAAYRVVEVVRLSDGKGAEYCLKVTGKPTGWYREVYFGNLLRNVARVIQVYESFAWIPNTRYRSPLYCLITELAEGGDLASWFQRNSEAWKESLARREIIGLLRVVARLHEHAVHRDITPSNVFVTCDQFLKLGDFGIATHPFGRRPVRADFFAPWFAPPGIANREISMWKQADDVYQLGQLYAMLLKGSAEEKLMTLDIKNLSCSPKAKSVIQRCIGPRRKRFSDAGAMLAALEKQEPPPKKVIVRSLKGKRVVFTGPLTVSRARAQRMVKKVGGIVETRVSHVTDILVVGSNSPLWKADTKGQKWLDVDREHERGHIVAVINEQRFKRLTGL